MNEELKELKKQVEDLTQIVTNLQLDKERDSRDYTQNRTFTERITFRGEVYDKLGNKVIN